jgi:hypothetical protein
MLSAAAENLEPRPSERQLTVLKGETLRKNGIHIYKNALIKNARASPPHSLTHFREAKSLQQQQQHSHT